MKDNDSQERMGREELTNKICLSIFSRNLAKNSNSFTGAKISSEELK